MKATNTRLFSQDTGIQQLTKTHFVMYQHQRAPLPLEQLKGLPQPVVVLLEKLLEKDPAHRFQTPTELLKTMPTITGAIYVRRKITRQSLLQTPPTVTRILSRKPRCKTHRIIVACSVKSKRSACPPSIVCALRPSPSGISERPTLAKRRWRGHPIGQRP